MEQKKKRQTRMKTNCLNERRISIIIPDMDFRIWKVPLWEKRREKPDAENISSCIGCIDLYNQDVQKKYICAELFGYAYSYMFVFCEGVIEMNKTIKRNENE